MAPLFTSALANWGDAPALLFPDRDPITYRELADRVSRKSAAFGPGKMLVAVEAAQSEHAIIGYLAALQAGHAVVMIPPDDRAQGAIIEEAFAPDISLRQRGGRWEMTGSLCSRGEVGVPPHPDMALLLMTSGSTGRAKAVRLSHQNLDGNAASIAQYLGLTPCDRSCMVLPLHYCYGLSVLHSHICAGASLYFPKIPISDPRFCERLELAGCTNFSGVPYSYELLESIDFRNKLPASLRFMTVAGGRLSPDIIRRYNRLMRENGGAFFAMYGQTEATARLAYVPPDQLDGNEDRIGIAIPGGALTLDDEEGRSILSPRQPGELVYRGPNVMMGYASARRDLAHGRELDCLKTGDLAELDDQGLFRICGRLKRISKIAGLRISHDAMEEALEKHGIRAAVVGDDQAIHAYCAGPAEELAVNRILAAASGLTLLQVGATSRAKLPRLSSGKIDYGRLTAQFSAKNTESDNRQETVQEVFAQLFYPARVGPRDSFLSLGGDSLRFVQLSIALERILGEAPPNWEKLSVSELARRVKRTETAPKLEASLLIRALAILFVVVQHETLWPIPGGSAAMVLLVGFGIARFQWRAVTDFDIVRLFRSALPIVIPYYLIVAGYAVAWGEVPWASVVMAGNFGFADPERHTMLPYLYWFIEAYCQMLLLFAGFFALPPVRKMAARSPFSSGLVLLGVALLARLIIPYLWQIGNRQIFTLPWMLYLAAIGFLAAFADTTAKRLLLMAAGTAVFCFFAFYESVWIGTRVKYLLQIPVLALLLFLPRLSVPRAVKALVLPVSTAGFHIYLLHRFTPELLLLPFSGKIPAPVFSILSIVGGVVLGVIAWWTQKQVLSFLSKHRDLPLGMTTAALRRHPMRFLPNGLAWRR
ncbi:AMP-binding protein [Pararhizobium sp. LjRoot235]|uniref:AMP-binding protein n=1 Tax=Pararhizobium sp. LjRoot235 TaxID=3342291 RepID=UPI003ED13451